MDHLLRNPEAGVACDPSLQPFFMQGQVYFLHHNVAVGEDLSQRTARTKRSFQSNIDAKRSCIVVRNVSSSNVGALALTVMVAPRLK